MIRNLKNATDATIVLTDLKGLTIEPGETVDGLSFGDAALRASVSVLENVLSGALAVGDGNSWYSAQLGIDLIKGTADQLTRDGKKIFTASDRPQDHYRHFTGAGDKMDAPTKRGAGTEFTWVVNPEEDPEHIDAQFLDDVYLKDGHISFRNAPMGSYFHVETYAPPFVPFPAPGNNGNTDIVNGVPQANNTNTGKYWRSPVETLLNRFINKLPLLGSGEREALSAEPVLIPTPYITRFSVHRAPPAGGEADPPVPMELILTLGLYRKSTF